MNYKFKLFLPVAASAMILGQVTTAQANDNKNGKGGGSHQSGGSAQVRSGGGQSHGTATRSTARSQSMTRHNTSYHHRSSATTTRSNATRPTTATTRASVARTSNGTARAHGTTLALNRNGTNIAGINTQARVRAGMGGVDSRTTIASNRFAYRAGNFHPNWVPGQTYSWNNCRWQCYNGVWAVFGMGWPFDWYAYPYPFWYNNWLYYAGDACQPGPDESSAAVGGGTSIVTNVQQDLIRQGYNPGPTDGLMGPATSNAIAAYQKDHELPTTGQINGPLLNSLGL